MTGILVETTALNALVHSESDIYIALGTRFVRKKAKDLNIGDIVCINAEHIDKDPIDVYPVLEQESLRYLLAKRTLFEQNKNGAWVTRFRTNIWRELGNPQDPNLAEIVLKEVADFSSREYHEVASLLKPYVTVAEETVRAWLRGDVIAPESWNNLNNLSQIGGNGGQFFAQAYHSYGQLAGFHAAYKLYTAMNSTIMSYLAARQGNGQRTNTSTTTTQQRSGKFTPEIEAVVKMFFGDIQEGYGTARITNIVLPTTHQQHDQQPHPRLWKGLDVPQPEQGKIISMHEVWCTHYLLFNAVADIINRYMIKKEEEWDKDNSGLENIFLISTFPCYTLAELVKEEVRMKEAFNNVRESYKGKGEMPHAEKILQKKYNEFLDDLAAGTVDNEFGFQPGTVATAFDVLNQYAHALPPQMQERSIINLKREKIKAEIPYIKNRREKRQREREVEKLTQQENALTQYLREHHQIDMNRILFSEYHGATVMQMKDNSPEKIEQLTQTPQILFDYKQQYEQAGIRFFTRLEAQFYLGRVGLQDLVCVYNQNSFLEN